jgi:hypothetical protein
MKHPRKFWMGRTPKDDSEKISRICTEFCPFVPHFVHRWISTLPEAPTLWGKVTFLVTCHVTCDYKHYFDQSRGRIGPESCQSFDARLRGRRRCEELRRKGSDRLLVFVRWEPGQLIVAAPMADAATIQVATIFGINNAAMLVFLMQAGFTMLEAGSVRERNVSLLAPLRLTRRARTLRTRRPRAALYHMVPPMFAYCISLRSAP